MSLLIVVCHLHVCEYALVSVSVCAFVYVICLHLVRELDTWFSLGIRSQSRPQDIMSELFRAMIQLGYVSILASCLTKVYGVIYRLPVVVVLFNMLVVLVWWC